MDGARGITTRPQQAPLAYPDAVQSVEPYRPQPDRLWIFRGHLMLMTDAEGRVGPGKAGLFMHQTRFLSQLDLRVKGKAAKLASVTRVGADAILAYYLAPLPEGAAGGPSDEDGRTGEIVDKGIEIQVLARLTDRLSIEYRIANHGLAATVAPLSWRVSADFVDQSDVRAGKEPATAGTKRSWDGRSTLTLESTQPQLGHSTQIRCSGPAAFRADGEAIACDLPVAPHGQASLRLDVVPLFFGEAPRCPEEAQAQWRAGCARIETPNELVQNAWGRAAADLEALILGDGEGEERLTPAAGAPYYLALFGRDTLMAGLQVELLNPAMLRGALGLVGRWTATAYDPRFDAQPGKVLHQRQLSPNALLGKTPFAHYYGDYSAPGLYLLGVVHAFAQSGDKEALRGYRDRILEILGWLDRDGDLDGDGFYEYRTLAGDKGLKNQGWKDSQDAILYPDGDIVRDPIALCEIQALYHAAKRALAAAFRCLGETDLADRLGEEALALKRRLRQAFWMPDQRFLALALDPQKRQVRTIASNPGDCVGYGALDQADAEAVAERLMQPDMFSGWGVRTLSTDHPAQNPLSYHLGSVWPSPNALLARGLKRYGQIDSLHRLAAGLLESTRLFEMGRMPELFGGHVRDGEHPHPGLYPEACCPQAWSAGALISLVATLVGFKPAAPLGAVVLDPALPDWLAELTLRDVCVGQGRISVRLGHGRDGHSEVEILENTSGLRLLHGAGWREESPDVAAFADALI